MLLSVLGSAQTWSHPAGPAHPETAWWAQGALRVIHDPSTGAHWLVVRDPQHPGGPGRLVRAGTEPQDPGASGVRIAGGQGRKPVTAPPRLVVRGGESLAVEDKSPMVETHLEAVALGPAAAGETLLARLGAGGKIVRVVALGGGRARLAAVSLVQP
ncbi:MAG: hypothetical protein WCA37_13335 [Terracidiphilus sp.]